MNRRQRLPRAALLALIPVIFSGCHDRRPVSAAPAPIRVVVRPVASDQGGPPFAYSGTIEESETFPQSFAVAGTVARVLVNEGDQVDRGTLLAEIDDATYRQTLEMARASLRQAEDAYTRLSRMYRNGHLAEVKYVEVATALERARASAAIAARNLADCRLRASSTGYVAKRSIHPGMVVMPHVDSITVVKIDRVFARVPVPENDLARLHPGDPATIRIGAVGAREFDGLIEEIGVVADPLAHSYTVRIAIANPDRVIKPGMVCTAAMKGLERNAGLVVPNPAVLVDETGRHYVYCLDGSGRQAHVRRVTLGELLQNGIRVTGGLKAGDSVVVSGQHKLTDGAAVQVVGQ